MTPATTPADPPRRWTSAALRAPVDGASLAVLRIVYGAIMLWEVFRYFQHGWIERYWIDPSFHFTYYGFEWVAPWPGDGMLWHMGALGALAALVMVGLFYRVAAFGLWLGFTYTFLLEQARYLNHFYLVSLIGLLMVCVPAHRMWSLDAWRRPALASPTVPLWSLRLMQFQIAVPYFYGGLAKLNPDWLAGEPMRTWLTAYADRPVLGPHVGEEWMVALFSYGGLLFDLLVVPLLVWRRTRLLALAAAVGFHLTNAWLFQIGIFPWFMIGATTLFLRPDWPRRALARLRRSSTHERPAAPGTAPLRPAPALLALLVVWCGAQLLVPLRHHLYPGSPSWSEEGHRFAWHMKLRTKRGELHYEITDPATGQQWIAVPNELLPRWQARKLAGRPDMILQYAHELSRQLRSRGHPDVEVRAQAWVSLNGRRSQLIVDPAVDLAREERSLAAADWIEPLRTQLFPPERVARAAGH